MDRFIHEQNLVHDSKGLPEMRDPTKRQMVLRLARNVVIATAAVLLFTIAEPPMATAGPLAPVFDGVAATMGISDATDFSALRRRRHYRRGNNAAGLAMFGMMIGTIGAITAQQQRNDYYNNYNNAYGPGYYGGGPYYGHRYYRRY